MEEMVEKKKADEQRVRWTHVLAPITIAIERHFKVGERYEKESLTIRADSYEEYLEIRKAFHGEWDERMEESRDTGKDSAKDDSYCKLHREYMKEYRNERGRWFSHIVGEDDNGKNIWCHGK